MVWVDIDEDILKKVQEATITDYEAVGSKVTIESLLGMVEDLLIELESKDDEIKIIIEDRENNYRQLTAHELYD